MIAPREGRPEMLWVGSFPAKPDQVAQSRQGIRAALAERPKFDAALGAQLLSELATNAILHSDSNTFAVIVTVTAAGRLRVAVSDSGQGKKTPAVRLPDSVEEGGRGLWLVAVLSESWGVCQRRSGGNTVWFELAPEDQQAATVAGMGSHDGR